MGWLGKRRGDEIRQAAGQAQRAIACNTGYMLWTAAWSGRPRHYETDFAEIPRTITGPLLTYSQDIDEALHNVNACTPPADLAELVDSTRRLLKPLLDLRPAWIAFLTSRLEGRCLSVEERESALGMDLDFGGYLLEEWQHEESAISAAIAVAPLLDRMYETLVPYSAARWTVLGSR